MSSVSRHEEESPAFAYHLLKCAVEIFSASPSVLDAPSLARARALARKASAIEALVLSSAPARGVRVPSKAVADALGAIRERYGAHTDFLRALSDAGLDEKTLGAAVRRELCFDAVLARVSAHAAPVTQEDIAAYYAANRERFCVPETRTARHILVTVNPDYAENTSRAAHKRLVALRRDILSGKTTFAASAHGHSECPSAVEGGLLGRVEKGRLYRELDDVLFTADAGEISQIVRSELGYHIVLCEEIHPAREISLSEAAAAIEKKLTARRRHAAGRDWIAALSRGSHVHSPSNV